MPELWICRWYRKTWQVLLQKRGKDVPDPQTWCLPGGSFEYSEQEIIRDPDITHERRLLLSKRAVLRELIEEAGGGEGPSRGCVDLPAFNHSNGWQCPPREFENVCLPPGIRDCLHHPDDPNFSHLVSQAPYISQFVYVLDYDKVDKGWQNWCPRADKESRFEVDEEDTVAEWGYVWGDVMDVLQRTDRPVRDSNAPLFPRLKQVISNLHVVMRLLGILNTKMIALEVGSALTEESCAIFAIRHAESFGNLIGSATGDHLTDPDLTELGIVQALMWQPIMKILQPDEILVSPLQRAVWTAYHACHDALFADKRTDLRRLRVCNGARESDWRRDENVAKAVFIAPHEQEQVTKRQKTTDNPAASISSSASRGASATAGSSRQADEANGKEKDCGVFGRREFYPLLDELSREELYKQGGVDPVSRFRQKYEQASPNEIKDADMLNVRCFKSFLFHTAKAQEARRVALFSHHSVLDILFKEKLQNAQMVLVHNGGPRATRKEKSEKGSRSGVGENVPRPSEHGATWRAKVIPPLLLPPSRVVLETQTQLKKWKERNPTRASSPPVPNASPEKEESGGKFASLPLPSLSLHAQQHHPALPPPPGSRVPSPARVCLPSHTGVLLIGPLLIMQRDCFLEQFVQEEGEGASLGVGCYKHFFGLDKKREDLRGREEMEGDGRDEDFAVGFFGSSDKPLFPPPLRSNWEDTMREGLREVRKGEVHKGKLRGLVTFTHDHQDDGTLNAALKMHITDVPEIVYWFEELYKFLKLRHRWCVMQIPKSNGFRVLWRRGDIGLVEKACSVGMVDPPPPGKQPGDRKEILSGTFKSLTPLDTGKELLPRYRQHLGGGKNKLSEPTSNPIDPDFLCDPASEDVTHIPLEKVARVSLAIEPVKRSVTVWRDWLEGYGEGGPDALPLFLECIDDICLWMGGGRQLCKWSSRWTGEAVYETADSRDVIVCHYTLEASGDVTGRKGEKRAHACAENIVKAWEEMAGVPLDEEEREALEKKMRELKSAGGVNEDEKARKEEQQEEEEQQQEEEEEEADDEVYELRQIDLLHLIRHARKSLGKVQPLPPDPKALTAKAEGTGKGSPLIEGNPGGFIPCPVIVGAFLGRAVGWWRAPSTPRRNVGARFQTRFASALRMVRQSREKLRAKKMRSAGEDPYENPSWSEADTPTSSPRWSEAGDGKRREEPKDKGVDGADVGGQWVWREARLGRMNENEVGVFLKDAKDKAKDLTAQAEGVYDKEGAQEGGSEKRKGPGSARGSLTHSSPRPPKAPPRPPQKSFQ
uniref:Nudix hydrolase domain-containing protein n=1 Tax=Chromera velia CCMP2878 TaxID=1169474 RepID=A0A0G4HV38_9ALVE|eukprot:Cvel_8784.t1-p1 / transcript=Cvel_8784.t1 / gene=Cvel_8784 / organism=Chromera_velia_CCMP2878 / gene_product=hypothetical protein / transcript_product=hypothetical protein / location=Cvel_scaffold491:70456-80337(+) / protein_length=1278 / sequence_SO=supercontig / SO=protein_coding / is_pseudo=false